MIQNVIDVITVNNVIILYARVTNLDQPIKFQCQNVPCPLSKNDQLSPPRHLTGLATFLLCGFTSLSLFILFISCIKPRDY